MASASSSHSATAAETAVPRNAWIQADFLFESVICDLHLMALTVGGFAILLAARASSPKGWTMKGWRSLLVDDSQAMRLTLRFHTDIGLPAVTASKISDFYAKVASAREGAAELSRLLAHDDIHDKTSLTRAAEHWRRLAGEAVRALQAAEAETRRRLPGPYEEDGRTLLVFLDAAAKGDTSRVSSRGEIDIPRLRQRRRSPRAAVRHACTLVLPGGRYPGEIEDVSREGLGLLCRQSLRENQEIVIELKDGRRLNGVVARRNGEHTGVRLTSALAAGDPLFGR